MTIPAKYRTKLWLAGAAIAAAAFGMIAGRWGLLGLAALFALGVAVIVFLEPEIGVWAAIGTIVIGQFIRIQLPGSDNTVIINDLLLPAVTVAWLLRRLVSRTWRLPRMSVTMPLAAMSLIMALSLVANAGGYSGSELLAGTFYFVRWLEYAAWFFIVLDMVRSRVRAGRYLALLVWSGVIVASLGFLQLRIYPDFTFMVPQGWDPHVGRLLSTWFDPNFLGGWLTLLVTVSLPVALVKPWRSARWWWLAIIIMTGAIVLTYSRSAYVGLAAGAGIVTLVRSRLLFLLGIAAFIGLVLFVPRINERVIGIRTIDETAQLRLVSWDNARTVLTDHPWIGVGYNLYKYVQVQYGFVTKTSEHSASGSDSSLLTIGVTTGIIGLLAYVWLYGSFLREAWRTWRDRSLPKEWQAYGLGLFAGLIAIFIHGQFINGLLYPHILQSLWLLIAMTVMIRQPHTS